MALGDEIDEVFRREVKPLPAYARRRRLRVVPGSLPEEMNHLLMGLRLAVPRSLHLLAERIEDMGKA